MRFSVNPAGLPGALIITPTTYRDDRGWFYESWNEREFATLTGLDVHFVQDNHSCSARNVLRGLHYQIHAPQGKLIRVSSGSAFDVIVDLRRHSTSFGRWSSQILSAQNKRMLWIPPGFAHGFLATENNTEMIYKTTDYWAPANERILLWNDPDLGVAWPLDDAPVLLAKDQAGTALRHAETYP